MSDNLKTPTQSTDIAVWISTLTANEVAFLHGCAFGFLARHVGISEAELYAEFTKKASIDPDCQIVVSL